MINCHPAAKKRKRRKEEKHIPRAKRGGKKGIWNVLKCFSEKIRKQVLWGDAHQSRTPLINRCPLWMLKGILWLIIILLQKVESPGKKKNWFPARSAGKKYVWIVLKCFSETIGKHVLWGDGHQSRTPLINRCPPYTLKGTLWLIVIILQKNESPGKKKTHSPREAR